MDKQNQTIKIYLSETEKNKITNQANEQQLSVSEYVKTVLIKGPVILYITTNDLLDYTCQIYETNCKIQELLSLLNQRNTIEADYVAEITKNLLTEINNNCNAALKINYNERKRMYQELEKQISAYCDA
ncbi:hypothetical protein SAMN02746066_04328 [Anaerosporobacter mobilis DSM 15930]|uniref:Uncharacterized protein n=1 Tax=Anaerosporobacter mobilis DSM 15930 TaxID=1120996 RepID=A0A1M7NB77_9FIRM|nr:hypothetical protein [Anaerosporobacter mobilis]SHN00433.1 hypothetical protein SAMN02746066_04328 [Anaerosporobacter mobilis DSM 15930]